MESSKHVIRCYVKVTTHTGGDYNILVINAQNRIHASDSARTYVRDELGEEIKTFEVITSSHCINAADYARRIGED